MVTENALLQIKDLAAVAAISLPTQQLCDDVRDVIHKHEARAVKEIALIGALLMRVKVALNHGEFTKWIKSEVRWNIRTAQRYMSVAENIGDKRDTVSRLPIKTVYDLAALPDLARQELIATIVDPANPPIVEIKKSLSNMRCEARQAAFTADIEAKQAERDAKKSKAGREAARKALEKRERDSEERVEQYRVGKEKLAILATGWLEKLGDLAPEVLAAIKTHGIYNVGFAISTAGATPTAVVAAPQKAMTKPNPAKAQEVTLPTSEYSDIPRSDVFNDAFDDQVNAQAA